MKAQTSFVKSPRILHGKVISNKMAKTVTVLVERNVKHPTIGKVLIRSKKYHAHLEGVTANEGDFVQIAECPPISRTKSWKVISVIAKNKS